MPPGYTQRYGNSHLCGYVRKSSSKDQVKSGADSYKSPYIPVELIAAIRQRLSIISQYSLSSAAQYTCIAHFHVDLHHSKGNANFKDNLKYLDNIYRIIIRV